MKRTIIQYKDKLYDITNFINKHPGGEHILKLCGGQDVTYLIRAMHPNLLLVEQMIKKYHISEVPNNNEQTQKRFEELMIGYIELESKYQKLGYFQLDYNFYLKEFLKLITIFMLFGLLIKIEYYLMAGFLLSIYWHQGAFLVHDLGHRNVTRNRLLDYYIAIIVSNFTSGTSVGWWKHNHNTHHIVTNDPEHDPDIQHLPFLTFSSIFFESGFLKSSYYDKIMKVYFWSKIQYLYYLPLLALGRFNLYFLGLKHLFSKRTVIDRKAELIGIAVFLIWYIKLIIKMPNYKTMVGFVVISHVCQIILHFQLVLSHSFMPIDSIKDHLEENYIERSLRTSLDISCPIWLDWFHGGLHYQSVHHLFPRITRSKFRLADPLLRDYCTNFGLTINSLGFVKANVSLFNSLKEVSWQMNLLLKVAKNELKH